MTRQIKEFKDVYETDGPIKIKTNAFDSANKFIKELKSKTNVKIHSIKPFIYYTHIGVVMRHAVIDYEIDEKDLSDLEKELEK